METTVAGRTTGLLRPRLQSKVRQGLSSDRKKLPGFFAALFSFRLALAGGSEVTGIKQAESRKIWPGVAANPGLSFAEPRDPICLSTATRTPRLEIMHDLLPGGTICQKQNLAFPRGTRPPSHSTRRRAQCDAKFSAFTPTPAMAQPDRHRPRCALTSD